MNDVNAYANMFSDASKRSARKKKVVPAAAGAGAASGTNSDASKVASKVNYTGNVAANVRSKLSAREIFKYRDELVYDFPFVDEAKYLLKDLPGLEYLGGVNKGGTIVLVSDGLVIIGDFSLPYFLEKK